MITTIDLALILLSLLAAYALVKLVMGLPKEGEAQEKDVFERWANEEEERE